ncbi:S1 family peptidase [Saccharothrix deserti]|uniref:S1 family peptidase n=1 Tax=Saccharothrix deserti TaxID=2593674 RepID=UPI00131AC520|nr:S1 family peptidase [Saccharothrix deserti]
MRTLLLVSALLVATATPASAATPLDAGTTLTTSTGARCSNGFNVRGYLLLSPRCGPVGTTVRAGSAVVGRVVSVSTTYAVVRIDNPSAWVQRPRIVGSTTTVTGSVEAAVGGAVCMSGRTTGWRCGTVQAKNQTVNFAEGTVHGLTRVGLCPQPGDEWAPVVSGSQAQGHLFGGSGCTAYFLPVRPILSAGGFTLVTG